MIIRHTPTDTLLGFWLEITKQHFSVLLVYSKQQFSVVIMGPTLTRKWEGLPQNSCNLITRIDQTLFQHPMTSIFFNERAKGVIKSKIL